MRVWLRDSGQAGARRRRAIVGVRVDVELGDAARPRVAVAGVDAAIELAPEAAADLPDDGDVRHGDGDALGLSDDHERPARRRAEGAQDPAAVLGHHFDGARRLHGGDLVPLQVERADVVRLELEPAAIEPDDLAGDPIAVGERDDVGAALGRGVSARPRGWRGSPRWPGPPMRAARHRHSMGTRLAPAVRSIAITSWRRRRRGCRRGRSRSPPSPAARGRCCPRRRAAATPRRCRTCPATRR